MKILLIGNHHSVFPVEIARKLREQAIEVRHVDFVSLAIEGKEGTDRCYTETLQNTRVPVQFRSLVRLRLLAGILKNCEDDVIHFHYARWFYALLIPVLKSVKVPAAATVYGSDYYRISGVKRWLQHRFFRVLDAVTFTNEATMRALVRSDVSLQGKCHITRFGLTPLEAIDRYRETDRKTMREALGLADFPLTVCCGYNASPGQQHLKMIESLRKLPAPLREKTLFLFPMTYSGSEAYKNGVKAALTRSGLHFAVFEEFLHGEKNAYVRLLPDVMVNMLVSDQLSGSMQEHLYAGNCVIAGAWLPYDLFEQRGAVFERVSSFEALPVLLQSRLEALPECREMGRNNAQVIAALSGWDAVIGGWLKLYETMRRSRR